MGEVSCRRTTRPKRLPGFSSASATERKWASASFSASRGLRAGLVAGPSSGGGAGGAMSGGGRSKPGYGDGVGRSRGEIEWGLGAEGGRTLPRGEPVGAGSLAEVGDGSAAGAEDQTALLVGSGGGRFGDTATGGGVAAATALPSGLASALGSCDSTNRAGLLRLPIEPGSLQGLSERRVSEQRTLPHAVMRLPWVTRAAHACPTR